MPEMLDYASPPPPPGASGGVWAVGLASAVAVFNWAGFGLAMMSDGRGLVEAFPCCLFNLPASGVLLLVAAVLAVGSIQRRRGRDVVGWLALVLVVAGAAGVWRLLALAGEAVAGV